MSRRSWETDAEKEKLARYELKMVCQALAYHEFRTALLIDPAGFRALFPMRLVQSVYLDTPEGDALEENLAGISHREKLRFRWYGPDAHQVSGTLECKIRENMLGWKRLLEIKKPLDVEGAKRHEFVRALWEEATPVWRARLAPAIEPVQWIAYEREYFGSADGKLRVTVDRELRTYDQRGRLVLSRAFESPPPNIVVMEIKCATAHYDEARRLINRLPFFVDKCSKFVTASMPEAGPMISIYPLAGKSRGLMGARKDV
ncbi:MAG: VTC domain-containing protein [Planctomycetota bacterium]|jgi:hypothetical protein